MKNILLVFTGGTIGSKVFGGSISTSELAGIKLLQLFAEQAPQSNAVSFKSIQPMQILSENLSPPHWTQIISAILAENISCFDGVIVTHGTDTLAFSAAALGFYFNDLTIPLLLVSSDLPLDHQQANGLANFICAIDFICRIGLGGVFVPYKNPGQAMMVHVATRLAASLQLSSDFIGIQSKAFMHYEEGKFTQLAELNSAERSAIQLNANFSANILLIRPYPGLDYSQFNLAGVKAILHDLYHAGTACVSADIAQNHSLIEFSKRCRQHNARIYLAPAIRCENTYSSTLALLAEGAEMIWNMSMEAAYVKLRLAYGNFDDPMEIDSFLEKDIAFEHI